MTDRKKVRFVLGSGSAPGWSHTGVVYGLREADMKIDMVWYGWWAPICSIVVAQSNEGRLKPSLPTQIFMLRCGLQAMKGSLSTPCVPDAEDYKRYHHI